MTLGESITYYRKRAGLSQEALAEKVGVSRQAVSKWELDDATPEVTKLVALAAAFGITTDQLLSGELPPEEPPKEAPSAPEPQPHRGGVWGKIDRMVGKYGWLAGLYIALRGAGVALVGFFARYMISRQLGMFEGFAGGLGTTAGLVSGPMDIFRAFRVLVTVIALAGAAVAVGGIVLAACLRKKGKD